MEMLGVAMEDSSYEHEYFLDLDTGEVLFLTEDMDNDESRQLRESVESESVRYLHIPQAGSDKGYQDMEDFIDTIQDEYLKKILETAIQGSGAFRRFKDALARYPEARELWLKFKDDRTRKRIWEWLSETGVVLSE